jgi:hypothetical protein
MAYTRNVPNSDQTKSASQPIIKNNFQIIYDIFEVNHVPYSSGSNQGKHKYVSAIDVGGVTPSGGLEEGVFFNDTENSRSNPYYGYDTGGSWTGADATRCPLLPIKALGRLQADVGTPFIASESWNVDSVTFSAPGGAFKWVVTLQNPMPTAFYSPTFQVVSATGFYLNFILNALESKCVSTTQFIIQFTSNPILYCNFFIVGL